MVRVHLGVQVKGGLFQALLGTGQATGPFGPELFATYPALWIAMQISDEPELTRVAVHTVPYAAHAAHATDADAAKKAKLAEVAEALSKPITGALIEPGSLGATSVGFTYAGSDTKGGDALGLKCTGCITDAHLAAGLLDAHNLPFTLGGAASTVEAEIAALLPLNGALHVAGARVGAGKDPAAACALDVNSANGATCVDGVPTLYTRIAANKAEMEGLSAPDGQLVYRKDTADAWMRAAGFWRRIPFEPLCGDGKVEAWEECDDGQANADAPDKCRTTCKKPICGDAIADASEQCDDGNTANTDGCIGGCKTATCGDGYVYAGVEECDNGASNGNTADKCRTTCKKPKCGDGIIDTGEQCDDGNANNTDVCSNACKKNVNVWTALALNTETPPKTMGTIPAVPGMSIVIDRLGMCGDSDVSSGDNRFRVVGTGVDFTYTAGQDATSATYDLGYTPTMPNGYWCFVYKDVSIKAGVGAALTITWDYHYDFDTKPCKATDSEGNAYDDVSTGSSVRAWLKYHYE